MTLDQFRTCFTETQPRPDGKKGFLTSSPVCGKEMTVTECRGLILPVCEGGCQAMDIRQKLGLHLVDFYSGQDPFRSHIFFAKHMGLRADRGGNAHDITGNRDPV